MNNNQKNEIFKYKKYLLKIINKTIERNVSISSLNLTLKQLIFLCKLLQEFDDDMKKYYSRPIYYYDFYQNNIPILITTGVS